MQSNKEKINELLSSWNYSHSDTTVEKFVNYIETTKAYILKEEYHFNEDKTEKLRKTYLKNPTNYIKNNKFHIKQAATELRKIGSDISLKNNHALEIISRICFLENWHILSSKIKDYYFLASPKEIKYNNEIIDVSLIKKCQEVDSCVTISIVNRGELLLKLSPSDKLILLDYFNKNKEIPHSKFIQQIRDAITLKIKEDRDISNFSIEDLSLMNELSKKIESALETRFSSNYMIQGVGQELSSYYMKSCMLSLQDYIDKHPNTTHTRRFLFTNHCFNNINVLIYELRNYN